MDYHFWGITFNRQTNSRENWCTSFIDYSNWYVGRLKSLFWGVWGFFLPCFCASSIRCVQVRGNRKYDFKNIWAPKYWPANHSLFSRMRYNKTIIVKLIKHQSNYRNGFFHDIFSLRLRVFSFGRYLLDQASEFSSLSNQFQTSIQE